jgi:lipoate synthase
MVLIQRSLEAPRSSSIAARSLVGQTSRRLCRHADFEEVLNNNAKYPRIPSKVLKKVHRMKKSFVVVEAVNNEVIDLERM